MNDTKQSRGLEKKEVAAVKLLLKSPLEQRPEDLLAACKLLKNLNAAEHDWMAIFTKSMLGKLLKAHLVRHTKDRNVGLIHDKDAPPFYEYSPERVQICQILAEFLQPMPDAFKQLKEVAGKEFPNAYRGEDLASNLTEPLSCMLEGLFPNRMRIRIPGNLEGSYARLAVQCAPDGIELFFEDSEGLLTADAAFKLAQFEGEELIIYGLKELSDEAAFGLAKIKPSRNSYSVGVVLIHDLITLSDSAAEALSKCPRRLALPNLVNVSSKAALALMQHPCLELTHVSHSSDLSWSPSTTESWPIPRLDEIAVPAMKELEGEIHLYTSVMSQPIFPEFLRSLAGHRGELFWYSGALVEDWLAECLQNHDGGLHFPNAWEIGDVAAEVLSNHKKGILELPKLKTLSQRAAKSLMKHPNLKTDLDLEAIAKGDS